ncbi:hypothetical protein JW851_03495 [Candidatus Woesearchaeota archaeon]|nr:hypothetical protein [Candidatus Woesearchaeota archaeon]
MKRILIAIAVFLVLAACAAQPPAESAVPTEPSESKEPSVMEQETYVPEEPETIAEMMPEERSRLSEHQSSDLYQAFVKGMQLCNYKLDDVLVRAWILSEDRFRIETAVPGTRISTVYDEDMVHSWDDRTKMGVSMKVEDLPTRAGERVAGIEIPRTPEQVKTSDVDVVCVKSTAIGEDILDIPGNVDFTDLTDVVAE